jgi:hypothetical protein
MIFGSFRQVGTVCAVESARITCFGGTLISRVIQISHNPSYTGAFVYGRYKTLPSMITKGTTRVRKVARDDWMVLIHDVHPA